MRAERFHFQSRGGHRLAALLDLPADTPSAYALFAHCFTCGKDVLAAKRIALALAVRGIAVLRFDFTGLGSSEGDFANSTFSSNVADLVRAADHLRETRKSPAILIGHSLGGAAVLAAAGQVPETRAVVTIGTPADPAHVAGLFKDHAAEIRERGEVEVTLAGRPFRIRREFLDDVAEQQLLDKVARLRRALLVMHAPTDEIVGIDNASRIFTAAKHPKSFVSLDDADHLLSRKRDGVYVADVIAAWSEGYLDMAAAQEVDSAVPAAVVVTETGRGRLQQKITAGRHVLTADEPVAVGGLDSGPTPYDLLLASLGACTAMTLRLYAERKKLPLDRVSVTLRHGKIHAADCEACETKVGMIDRIDKEIVVEGNLDDEARARLLEIADKCPVNRTLKSEIDIRASISAPPEAGDHA